MDRISLVKKGIPEGTKQDNILCNSLNTIKKIKGWVGKRWK
jgi:hypothetical protein